MNRNALVLAVAALAIAAAVLGYMLYQERQSSGGIQIEMDDSGVSIESN